MRSDLSETIMAFRFILADLMADLEKAGMLSRRAFAERLRAQVDDAEKTAPAELKNANRLDLQIGRLFADTIDPPKPEEALRWTPVVYENRSDE